MVLGDDQRHDVDEKQNEMLEKKWKIKSESD